TSRSGLALESLLTLITIRFMPFFMIMWIISMSPLLNTFVVPLTWISANVSVCMFPVEVLPVVFRYGYAMPFYNVSHAVRCIVFGTKN
ncbi:DUF3533 domain-containing protein, partial [Alkalibacillus haloalkaliphilus]|uniref:DUF3533 domain-containing protein n=1 Tax=Alkalibacillus haloalkaliphilus TaxID=94136 RepID=UPI002936C1A4